MIEKTTDRLHNSIMIVQMSRNLPLKAFVSIQ